MQEIWVQSPIPEDPTCPGATKPLSHNCCTVLQSPCAPQKTLPRRSKPSDGESACTATKTQHSQKCKKLYACIWKWFFQDCPKHLEALQVSRSRGSGAGWHLMRSQGFHSTSYSAEDSPLDEGFPAGLGDEPSWVSTWLGSRALSLTQTLGVTMEVFCGCG